MVQRNFPIAKSALIGVIRFYQLLVSPFLPSSCRFYPSCSQYAIDAVKIHGALKGTWLIVKRVIRCNPWSDGGVDCVPGQKCEHFLTSKNK